MTNKKKLELFLSRSKPIIGMIHLKGKDLRDIYNRAVNEIDIMINNGIDAVMVENYFGSPYDVTMILDYLYSRRTDLIYGVNILGDFMKSYYLADSYGATFIQVDSVAGHLRSYDDMAFEKAINFLRETSDTFLLGGVRFKYQPYISGRSLEEDLELGMERCDAIVVTGNATGKETDLDKIKKFRSIIGTFPLVVGAGLTTNNCENQLNIADAGIIGSYLKDNHQDNGEVSEVYTKEFMDKVKTLRIKK